MASLTLRTVKGLPLTHTEIDNNFSDINDEVQLKANIASPSFTGDVGVSGSLTVGGDLSVQGTVSYTNVTNLSVADTLIYVNRRVEASITNAVGDGTYVTYTAENNYSAGNIVTITGIDPISFNVVDAVITSATSTYFVIASSNTDTYVSGGSAYAKSDTNVDMGIIGGYYDDGYAHTGFFRDASDDTWKAFKGLTIEPGIEINTAHASFELAPIAAAEFIGPLTGDVSGNASTADSLSTARSITLNGILSGTADFDGSSNITITTSMLASNLTISGVMTAADFNSTSDAILKENIETITNPLDIVNSLRGINFNWKDGGKSAIGVIAQEVEKVLPQIVTTGSDGIKRVSYDSLVPILIEAIKELSSKINK